MNRKARRSDCPIANTLDIIGDRWTLVILRDAIFRGATEFNQFLQADEGISTNILAERLQRLCDAGILTRNPHPDNGKKNRYVLTDTGLDLAPVLLAVIDWGVTHIADTVAPPPVLAQMRADRTQLIRRIRNREVLVPLDATP